MPQISKITASPVAVSNELTAALGVLNFDFSLIKIDAPVEYKALGAALSSNRRHAAEEGNIHTTARKLRSLFDQLIPETPELNKAYGVRASGIASATESGFDFNAGPFTEHAGIDGSSIWAAATSGTNAIAIHLLACMLARMWPAAEATSIWEEMIIRRKQEMRQAAGSNPHPDEYHRYVAVRSEITRSQLAEWDASARAWLRAADGLDRKQGNKQKKLHLIIDNVRVPVNAKSKTYESVVHAWTTAMRTIDRLISGVPQSITDGAALLGLSSWHLYPDMVVLGATATEIKSGDPLFKHTGMLTLGLSYVGRKQEGEAPPAEEEGIYWSLPLAHLRYYGQPVVSKSALNVNHSHLTLSELTMIALGSMFRSWGAMTSDYEGAMQCLVPYRNFLEEEKVHRHKETHDAFFVTVSKQSWLTILADASQYFLTSTGQEKQEAFKLFNLGRRKPLKFLAAGGLRPPALFGLCKPSELLALLREDDRIAVLRSVAHKLGISVKALVIRYRRTDQHGKPEKGFHYASVDPIPLHRGKADVAYQDKTEIPDTVQHHDPMFVVPDADGEPRSHHRWLTDQQNSSYSVQSNIEVNRVIGATRIIGPIKGGSRFFWSDAPCLFNKAKYDTIGVDDYFGQFAELALFRSRGDPRKPKQLKGIPFEFLFGDPETAAIYTTVDMPTKQKHCQCLIDNFPVEEVHWALRNDRISQSSLLEQAMNCLTRFPNYVLSLKAFATVHVIYSGMEGATFPMAVTQCELYPARWIPGDIEEMKKNLSNMHSRLEQVTSIFGPFQLSRQSSFACIATFELGGKGISHQGLDIVMAMAVGDSIYIAASLASDPFDSHLRGHHEIKRFTGNIGKAGIALMVPPKKPEMRQFNQERWRIVEHKEFDGDDKDCSEATSLHLSFTGFAFPLDVGEYGGRDTEVYILETLISVHERGEWVADLAILPCLESNLLRPMTNRTRCSRLQHGNESSHPNMVSIDCWDEFLDFPEDPAVVRAHGNWLSRLAYTAASVQNGYLTLLFGPDSRRCWECAREERERFRHVKRVTYII